MRNNNNNEATSKLRYTQNYEAVGASSSSFPPPPSTASSPASDPPPAPAPAPAPAPIKQQQLTMELLQTTPPTNISETSPRRKKAIKAPTNSYNIPKKPITANHEEQLSVERLCQLYSAKSALPSCVTSDVVDYIKKLESNLVQSELALKTIRDTILDDKLNWQKALIKKNEEHENYKCSRDKVITALRQQNAKLALRCDNHEGETKKIIEHSAWSAREHIKKYSRAQNLNTALLRNPQVRNTPHYMASVHDNPSKQPTEQRSKQQKPKKTTQKQSKVVEVDLNQFESTTPILAAKPKSKMSESGIPQYDLSFTFNWNIICLECLLSRSEFRGGLRTCLRRLLLYRGRMNLSCFFFKRSFVVNSQLIPVT